MTVRSMRPTLAAALVLLPVLTILQTSLAQHLVVAGAHPNFVLMAIVDWGIIRGVDEGMLWGLLGGLFVDLYSGLPFGTSSLAFVLIAGAVSLGESALMRTHFLLPLLAVFGATILYYAVALFIIASARHVLLLDSHTVHVVIAEALYNGALNTIGFALTLAFERKLHPIPRANW